MTVISAFLLWLRGLAHSTSCSSGRRVPSSVGCKPVAVDSCAIESSCWREVRLAAYDTRTNSCLSPARRRLLLLLLLLLCCASLLGLCQHEHTLKGIHVCQSVPNSSRIAAVTPQGCHGAMKQLVDDALAELLNCSSLLFGEPIA